MPETMPTSDQILAEALIAGVRAWLIETFGLDIQAAHDLAKSVDLDKAAKNAVGWTDLARRVVLDLAVGHAAPPEVRKPLTADIDTVDLDPESRGR
jgi:hypothetical protein